MAPELFVLALEFYRAPLRFRQLTDPKAPLHPSFDRFFGDLGAVLGGNRIADTATELGTTEQELVEAALFLVRHIMLAPGSDCYRILGLSRDASPQTVRRHYLILAGLLHPDRHPGAEAEHNPALLVRVNLAYETLSSPEARQRYDAALPRQGRKIRWVRPAALPPTEAPRVAAWHHMGARVAGPRFVLALIAIGLVAGLIVFWASTSTGRRGSTAGPALGTGGGRTQIESAPEALGGRPPAPTEPRTDRGTVLPERGPDPISRLDDAQPAQPQNRAWSTGTSK